MPPTPAPASTWLPSAPCRSPAQSALADPNPRPSSAPRTRRAAGGRPGSAMAGRWSGAAGLLAALVGGVAVALVVSGLMRLASRDDGTGPAGLAPASGAEAGRAPGHPDDAGRAAATAALLEDLRRALEDGDV